MRKIREKINIYIAKTPRKAVLIGIMIFNLVFVLVAAGVIAILSHHINGLKECTFWQAIYYTITMILDAGCIDNLITDAESAGIFATFICIGVAVIGMILFTGAVIGYATNCISDFIESKNNGKNKLFLSDHIVLINWNSRGTEIMNEFLYANKAITIVIFVPDNRDAVEEEIRNRLDTTLLKQTNQVQEEAEKLSGFERKKYLKKNLPEEKITYIVREGDVASAGDLDNICISRAGTVIILDSEADTEKSKGNMQTIKTLIQVSEISKGNSNQVILVEVNDEWTEELVDSIVEFKSKDEKEKIYQIPYNRMLGKTNAQIAISPEFNDIYNILFSNSEYHFVSMDVPQDYSRENENAYIEKMLSTGVRAIPLTIMNTSHGSKAFFMVKAQDSCVISSVQQDAGTGAGLDGKVHDTGFNGGVHGADFNGEVTDTVYKEEVPGAGLRIAPTVSYRKRNIVIMGHNSNMESLMRWLEIYRSRTRHKDGSDALNIVLIDDAESLAGHDYYREYPDAAVFDVDIYDGAAIEKSIRELFGNADQPTTVLILSDDKADQNDIDAGVFARLVYLRQHISRMEAENKCSRDMYTIIAEVLNPKNEDIVKNYGADKVIVSGRYQSRVIAQVSMDDTLCEFYADVLAYDYTDIKNDGRQFFIADAGDFFEELPGKCTAGELVRNIFAGCGDDHKALMLGYIRDGKNYTVFHGDLRNTEVELRPDDKLIFFSRDVQTA